MEGELDLGVTELADQPLSYRPNRESLTFRSLHCSVESNGGEVMLEDLFGKKVEVHFIDGTHVIGGVLEQSDDRFVKYVTDYQVLYIPITSIRAVAVDTKERKPSRVGFTP
jgi:hypothetical protein